MNDGMTYAPRAHATVVVEKGAFPIGVIGLDHGHIIGMTQGLVDAGATVAAVYDPDPSKVVHFRSTFPSARVARSGDEILADRRIQLIASATVPVQRGPLGLAVQRAGKHYFSDKAPFTTLEQLDDARQSVAQSGKIWAVCYSERLQNESALFAGQLIEQGAIGRVLQVVGLGPHRLRAETRPEWFFQKEHYGGSSPTSAATRSSSFSPSAPRVPPPLSTPRSPTTPIPAIHSWKTLAKPPS